MRGVRGIVVAAVCVVATTAGAAGASGATGPEPAGGGSERWSVAGLDLGYGSSALSPDGATIFAPAAAEWDAPVVVVAYDATSGAQRWSYTFPTYDASAAGSGFNLGRFAVSPDSSTLYVSGYVHCFSGCPGGTPVGAQLSAFSAATGELLWSVHEDVATSGGSVAVSPDGATVVMNVGGPRYWENTTLAYRASTGERLWTYDVPADGAGLEFAPDGKAVLLLLLLPTSNDCVNGGGFRTVALDPADGGLRWQDDYRMEDGDFCGSPTTLRVSPDSSAVYVTGFGGAAQGGRGEWGVGWGSATIAYDAGTGDRRWVVRDDEIGTAENGNAFGLVDDDLAVSPDGSKVLVLGADCTLGTTCPIATAAYDAATGSRLWISHYDGGGTGNPTDLAISPDGTTAYVTGVEGMPCFAPCYAWPKAAPVVAYDVTSGAERWATLYEDDDYLRNLHVSPDGAHLYLLGSFLASVGARPGPGTFQDTDPSVTLDGWRTVYDGTALGGGYRASNVKGSTVRFTLPDVPSFTWVTRVGPDQGIVQVTVDGEVQPQVDLFDRSAATKRITYTVDPARRHVVEVRVLGAKNRKSTGTWVAVDAFTYGVSPGITQESSPQIRYGAWRRVVDSTGSYRWSASPESRMSMTFEGTSVSVVAMTGPTYGRALVVVDGKKATLDLYRADVTGAGTFTYSGLRPGRHQVSVRPLGTRNPASVTNVVKVDAFVVGS